MKHVEAEDFKRLKGMFNKEQILSSLKEEICELCAQAEHGPRLDASWLVTTTTTTKTVFVPSIMRY